MRTIPWLLVTFACGGGDGSDKDSTDAADTSADASDADADTDSDADADTDADADSDADADTDADADADTDADTDTSTDTGTPGTTGGGSLAPGFEANLTVLGACFGTFVAHDPAGTVGLIFDANDLSGAAFLAGTDTTTNIDLAVEGWRVQVSTGTGLDEPTLCAFAGGKGTVVDVYTAASGDATVWIWPHQTQPERNEGELELSNVLLTSPGHPDVSLPFFAIPRLLVGDF